MAHLLLIVDLLRFSEEKLSFKFSFIHVLHIMYLSVKKVELNISEHEKITRYFFLKYLLKI